MTLESIQTRSRATSPFSPHCRNKSKVLIQWLFSLSYAQYYLDETNKERHLKISKKPESITKEATENGHSLGLGNQAKLSEPQNVYCQNTNQLTV